jgi:hypothetical protein
MPWRKLLAGVVGKRESGCTAPFPGEGKASQKIEKRPVEAGVDLQFLFSNFDFLISAW